MNTNSALCSFIHRHPATWREELSEKKIAMSDDKELTIFNYSIDADFSDPVVQEARGIIINTKTLEVVCWPFRKFGNYNEGYADEIDWDSARVQEKVDGSIVKYWWNERDGRWQWSTNSVIDAANAPVRLGISFLDLIRQTTNYDAVALPTLWKHLTYIFELVGPQNQVVVKYPRTHLVHIGTRNNRTGEELDYEYLGVIKPKSYSLHSLEACIHAAERLNASQDGVVAEGFVVVDKNWHRIKIKSPEYLVAHGLCAKGAVSGKTAIKLIREGRTSLVKQFPMAMLTIKYYEFKLLQMEIALDEFLGYAKSVYEKAYGDRRELGYEIGAMRIKMEQEGCAPDEIERMEDHIYAARHREAKKFLANRIGNHVYSYFGFKSIGYCYTAKEMMDELSAEQLAKYICPYDHERAKDDNETELELEWMFEAPQEDAGKDASKTGEEEI